GSSDRVRASVLNQPYCTQVCVRDIVINQVGFNRKPTGELSTLSTPTSEYRNSSQAEEEWQGSCEGHFNDISLKRIWLVDVAGIEPATPCLQSREGKTLKCFDGVAYRENQQNSRSPVVPKLY